MLPKTLGNSLQSWGDGRVDEVLPCRCETRSSGTQNLGKGWRDLTPVVRWDAETGKSWGSRAQPVKQRTEEPDSESKAEGKL